jgi:hypothetical protein
MEDELTWKIFRGLAVGSVTGMVGAVALHFADPDLKVKVNKHAASLPIPVHGLQKDVQICKYWAMLAHHFKYLDSALFIEALTKCDDLYFIADRFFGTEEAINNLTPVTLTKKKDLVMACFQHMQVLLDKLRLKTITLDKKKISMKDNAQRKYDVDQKNYLLAKADWEKQKSMREYELARKGIRYTAELRLIDDKRYPCPQPPILPSFVEQDTLLDKFNKIMHPILQQSEEVYGKIRMIYRQQLPKKIAAIQKRVRRTQRHKLDEQVSRMYFERQKMLREGRV